MSRIGKMPVEVPKDVNIDIKEDVQSYPDHHSNLAKHLAVGSGADDIESIEVGFIAQFKSQPNLFVNLKKLGANSLRKQWLGWKWQQSIAPNGARVLSSSSSVRIVMSSWMRSRPAKASLICVPIDAICTTGAAIRPVNRM